MIGAVQVLVMLDLSSVALFSKGGGVGHSRHARGWGGGKSRYGVGVVQLQCSLHESVLECLFLAHQSHPQGVERESVPGLQWPVVCTFYLSRRGEVRARP